MNVLIDSDILIEVSRGKNQEIISRWLELSHSDSVILYSPVSVVELWAGARPYEYETISKLFGSLICVPLDQESGRQAGIYLQQYRRTHGIENADALIAANAVENRAALWTRNRKHYPMQEVSFF